MTDYQKKIGELKTIIRETNKEISELIGYRLDELCWFRHDTQVTIIPNKDIRPYYGGGGTHILAAGHEYQLRVGHCYLNPSGRSAHCSMYPINTASTYAYKINTNDFEAIKQ